MKREVNMIYNGYKNEKKQGTDLQKKRGEEERINTDPFGSWTGVPTDDVYEKPIQDVDDL